MEKSQVISTPFNGAVACMVWIPSSEDTASGFAFGCADGSVHIYNRPDSSVSYSFACVRSRMTLIRFSQHEYQYVLQETAHAGPVLDIKYDSLFGRIATVGCGSSQVWSCNADRKCTSIIVNDFVVNSPAGSLRAMNPTPTTSHFTAISVNFWEDGASLLVCTLETHTV